MTLNWIEINPSEIRKSSITYRRIFDKCILCEEKEDREIHTAEHVAMKCKSFKCASASATGSCPVQYKQIICSFDGNTSTTRSAHHTAPFEQITPKKERRIKDDVAEVVRHLVTLHPNHSPTRLRILVHMECTRLGVVICESQIDKSHQSQA
ncbi:hypothetical protein BC833DRAFT_438899 [Globomyces pollinis-pini]|nr:hypothetical protein BC833DRAFT_438899 [Globomyces pollinis-pini]